MLLDMLHLHCYPFVRIHGRKLVLHLIRLNNVLAVSRMVAGKDYWVWGGGKQGMCSTKLFG